MKMIEDPRLLAHKRAVEAERKAKAVGKIRVRQHNARLAMARIAAADSATYTNTVQS